MTTVGRRIQRRADMLRAEHARRRTSISLRQRPERAQRALSGPPDRRHPVLPRPRSVRAARARSDPEAARARRRPSEELRVWCAGCATGEEAYSLAMLFVEAVDRARPARAAQDPRDRRPPAVARDREHRHLRRGAARERQPGAPRAVLHQALDAAIQVSPELRQLIVFARHNVTKDAPFTKMHFISCRNMLIYLQPQAQRTVLSLFHFALSSGGVLFLGASETPGRARRRVHRHRRALEDLPQAPRRPRCSPT